MQKRMIKKNVFSAVLLIAVAVSIGLLPTHSDVPLAAGPANLEIVSFSAPPNARKGNDIAGEVTLTIRNGGTTDITGNFYVGFYLSSDAAITRADRLLVKGRKMVLSVPAGATSSVAIDSLRIPMSAFLGGGFIGVIVDEFDHVAESSDTDNAASLPIIISTTKPDGLV